MLACESCSDFWDFCYCFSNHWNFKHSVGSKKVCNCSLKTVLDWKFESSNIHLETLLSHFEFLFRIGGSVWGSRKRWEIQDWLNGGKVASFGVQFYAVLTFKKIIRLLPEIFKKIRNFAKRFLFYCKLF